MNYEGMSRDELLEVLHELRGKEATDGASRAERLLHDLQVHQVELEMQNRELREVQGALEESRNRYHDLYDFAPVAYCTLDPHGIVQELNLTAATLFGRPREQAQGMPFASLVKLHHPRGFWQHLGRCVAAQGPVVSELTLTIAERIVEVEAVSVPVLAVGKRASAFRTAFMDITRRKRAEAEREDAHRSERLLRERLQALDTLHIEIAARLAGTDGSPFRDIAEVITQHARSLLEADHAAIDLIEEEQGAAAAAMPAGERGVQDPDREVCAALSYGSRLFGTLRVGRPHDARAFSERDRETLGMLATRVSSGLQIATLAAREARDKERLALFERASRELNRTHDHAGTRASIERILQGAVERFADSALFYLHAADECELVAASHPQGFDDQTRATLRSSAVCRWLTSSLVNGRAHLLTFPERTADFPQIEAPSEALARGLGATSLAVAALSVRGREIGVLCFGRGRTREGFSASELIWIQEIAYRCGLSFDNVRLFEELRAALEWRETLLATISHDLKSPLSAIKLSALSLVPDKPIKERRSSGRQIALINRSADHMNNMINDLLLESLLVAGSLQLERADQPLLPLIAEACQLAEPLLAARGLSLERDIAPDLPALAIDKERVLRVFSNLVGNAAKFSPRGASIRISAARGDPGLIAFAVHDKGPGIAPEQQAKIFDRYWRGTSGARGLGLGLFIAKSVVEAHGGSIWVESALEHGAIFRFTLPLATLV